MQTFRETRFKERCLFQVSLRYELFYSLNALLDPASRIHSSWRRSARDALGSSFQREFLTIGGAWDIWPVLAATLPGLTPNPSFDEVIEGLRSQPIEQFQRKILLGEIHSEEAVAALLKEKLPLRKAIAKVPKAKQEWLAHIGLFPFQEDAPHAIAIERLVSEPEEFRGTVVGLLKRYWVSVFENTWRRLQPQYQRSLEEKERLFQSCTFAEFARQSLLRVEVDEGKYLIKAVRGGCKLPFKDIEACYFQPSAFNDRRFWSAFDDNDGKTHVYFPYFDPVIALDLQPARAQSAFVEPALDPALIFKCLGDSTRYAIASVVARAPKSSVELAKMFSVSKPTISHHVQQMREAGLINETYIGGSVQISLKREVFENLSGLTVHKLFHSNDAPDLKVRRSRNS
ncbi:MAG: ArsR family transcriptional regulator [Oligoflexia bacterium]|nr:ArsR family transcriptional regulator [Oligoflexia bacterium]